MIRDGSEGLSFKNLTRAAVVMAAVILGACSKPPPPLVRNVVLICFDTVRYDTYWLPEMADHPDALSPWNARATVWTHALASGPWTIPSVGSVMTGVYPSQHGGGLFEASVANLSEAVPSKITDGLPTMAELMMQADMRTVGYSSHPWFQSGYGLKRGFRKFSLFRGAERLLQKAGEWLDDRPEDAFFLYLHFMDAHDRHVQPEHLDQLRAQVEPALADAVVDSAPANVCDEPRAIMCRRYQAYALTVMELRGRLASFLDDLERRGLLAETAVMVYSDHGEEFHDHLTEAQALAVDPRGIYGFGHGQSLYQELLHVPLLAWVPDAQGVIHEPASLVDVAPTLLAWSGARVPESMEGRVLEAHGDVAQLDAETLGRPWPESDRVIFSSGIAYGPEQFAALRGRWKYVWHQDSRREELFDLATDPSESAPREQETVATALDARLDEYLGWYSEQDFRAPELSSDQLARLKGIGYLQGVGATETVGDVDDPERIAPAKAAGHN